MCLIPCSYFFELCRKGAGHDLAGLMAYMSAIEMRPRELRLLHVPLMALIDFRGYRLVAICVLPIDRRTICYGSFDAGKTVHSSYPECNAAMKEIGQFLNIMGHRGASSDHLIYAPIDIEAHKGKDGKVARFCFLCLRPLRKKNSVLCVGLCSVHASAASEWQMGRISVRTAASRVGETVPDAALARCL